MRGKLAAMSQVPSDLIALSRELGRPDLDLVILGEGNTACRGAGETFWVKASGTSLAQADGDSFVEVRHAAVLAMLDAGPLDDATVRERLLGARVGAQTRTPSIETLLHAICLTVPGVQFVGHTHPTAVNAITCSTAFPQALQHRLFPDEIVVCGKAPVLVDYADPGIPLARAVYAALRAWQTEHGEQPRVMWLQNHGLLALGASQKQVLDVTLMAVKTARILAGALACGGIHALSSAAAARIHTRPDEHLRQRTIAGA